MTHCITTHFNDDCGSRKSCELVLLRVEALEIFEAADSCVAASVLQEKALRSDMIILTLSASPHLAVG